MKDKSHPKQRAAVALNYDGKGSPIVTAKGNGEVATRIIEIAEQHGIPIQQDPTLTSLLSEIPLDQEIPETLYIAVAEILAFVYALTGKSIPGKKNQHI